MADIRIHRAHTLGLAKARKIAFTWAEQVETEYEMECVYEEGQTSDLLSFKRVGVNGTFTVTKNTFELHAKLGFLMGAFKEKIEAEITNNLDALLAKPVPAKRTKQAIG